MAAASPSGIERWRSKVALVTGASQGIGYEIAKTLANQGMVVYGIARNIQPIQVFHIVLFNVLLI